MRIVYLHQYFRTPEMAGGTRSYEFARRLVEAGHDVHMVTSDTSGGSCVRESTEAGIRVTWIPVAYSNDMRERQRLMAFAKFAYKSASVTASSNADVIFATSTPLTIAIPAIFAKYRQKSPLVLEVRDLWPSVPIELGYLSNCLLRTSARFLERLAYSQSEAIVALSEGMREGIIASGTPASKVTVIPNSCDLAEFDVDPALGIQFRRRFDWLGDRPLVSYSGTLGFANDVSYMVKLAAAVYRLDPEIRFATIGDGAEREMLAELSHRHAVLGRNFFMLPPMPKDEIVTVFSASTVTASWFRNSKALWANSANKFFDSLAAGKPIVINYEGWQADLIRGSKIGLVLDPTDVDQAARMLVEYVHDDIKVEAAGRSARKLGEARFGRDDLASMLEAILASANQM